MSSESTQSESLSRYAPHVPSEKPLDRLVEQKSDCDMLMQLSHSRASILTSLQSVTIRTRPVRGPTLLTPET